jgi:ribonuclease HI
MELMAVIKALEALPVGSAATLHSDSEYVVKGITAWITGWKVKGRRTAARKPVLNVDLWQLLDALNSGRQSHGNGSGDMPVMSRNERLDGLANAEAMKAAEATL